MAPQEIVPVQVELPEQSSHRSTETALEKAAPVVCEESIEIRTGNIRIRLPKDTPAGYLAGLVWSFLLVLMSQRINTIASFSALREKS